MLHGKLFLRLNSMGWYSRLQMHRRSLVSRWVLADWVSAHRIIMSPFRKKWKLGSEKKRKPPESLKEASSRPVLTLKSPRPDFFASKSCFLSFSSSLKSVNSLSVSFHESRVNLEHSDKGPTTLDKVEKRFPFRLRGFQSVLLCAICAHAYTDTPTHTHTRTHTKTPTHTNTHTHAHLDTSSILFLRLFSNEPNLIEFFFLKCSSGLKCMYPFGVSTASLDSLQNVGSLDQFCSSETHTSWSNSVFWNGKLFLFGCFDHKSVTSPKIQMSALFWDGVQP